MATSAQSGNWNVGSTWVGGVVPTDQAVIANGHVVTVSADATVGTSGTSGTVDITVNQGGELVIASAATLTAKGGINVQKGAKYTQNGHLMFSAASGVEYKLSYVSTGTGSSALTVLGPSPTNRATMRVEGGGTARIDAYSASSSTDVDFENLLVFGLGTSSVKAFTQYMLLATTKSRMKNVAFVGCGKVDCTLGLGAQVLDWDVDIRKPLSYSAFGLNGSTDNTTGSRTLKIRCYSETLCTVDLNIRDLQLLDEPILVNTQLINVAASALRTSGKLTSLADAVVPIGTVLVSTVAKASHNFSDVTFLAHYNNQHYCGGNEGGTLIPSTWSNVLFDGDGYVDPNNAGDCIMAKDPSTFTNVININKAGTLFSGLASTANITIKNATCYKSFGLAIGETVGSPTQLADLKNVIFSEMERGVYQNNAFVSMTNNPIDYVGFWSMTTAANIDHPLLGVNSYMGAETYAPWFSTGSFDGTSGRGMHDINADPMFKDPSRTIRKWFGHVLGVDTSSNAEWSVTKLGGRLCEVGGVDVDGNIVTPFTGLTPAACRAWIREGFTPQNAVYKGTGEGGADFGAVPVVPLASVTQPTLSTPIISGVGQNGAAFSAAVNKSGTLFFTASTATTATEEVVRGDRSVAVSAGDVGGTIDGLIADTGYRIFAQFVDSDGLKTDIVPSAQFRTAAIPVPATKQRRIKLAKWDFGSNYRDAVEKQPLWDWFANTFDAVVSGTSYTPTSTRNGFLEIQYEGGCISCDLPDENLAMLRAWCDTKGYDVNLLLVHMNADYTPQCKTKGYAGGWSGRDKFRAWLGATDVTNALYDATTTITLNQPLLLAQDYPFDQINVDIVTAGVGGSYTIEYWNGTTWATQPKTDGVSNFTVDGQIAIVPQPGWARSKQAGNYSRYFMRIVPTGYTTAPVIQSMKADSWNNADGTARGWDATSGTIVNSGELAYNPTPPAGKSAKFPHQSIVCGYFYPNRLMFNSGYYVGETCVEGQYYYELWRQHLLANSSINAILWDTAYVGISSYVVSVVGESSAAQAVIVSHMDIDFTKYSTWDELNGRRYKYSCDRFKAEFPYVKIFGNLWACPAQYVEMGDGIELEYYNQYIPKGVYPRLVEVNDVLALSGVTSATEQRYRTYDGFLPENNPNGIIGFMMYLSHAADWTATGGYWDRANRSPILQLAKHLISYNPANDKCYFLYQHQNSATYSMTDEIMVWKYSTTLTNALSVDTSTATKTINGVDFSKLHEGFDSWVICPRTIKIGNDILQVSVVNSTTLTTISPITEQHAIGATIRLMACDRWVERMDNPPAVEDVYAWSHYFPALDVDFGIPDVNGHNGGVRDWVWKTYAELGSPRYTEIWRRDFTNCIVLLRAGYQTVTDAYLQDYCDPIALGGTYYPLKADGTVGPGITEISLRAAEAAILMKSNDGGVTPEEPTKPTITTPVVTVTGQTTATATLTCDTTGSTLLYIVTANATEQEAAILAGASQAVTNTGPQTILITNQSAGSTRYLHVICVPANAGADNSDTKHSSAFELKEYPPVLTVPTGTAVSNSVASGTVVTDKVGGLLYAIEHTSVSATRQEILARSGIQVLIAGTQRVVISPLTGATTYRVSYIHVDAKGNESQIVTSDPFVTMADPEIPTPVPDDDDYGVAIHITAIYVDPNEGGHVYNGDIIRLFYDIKHKDRTPFDLTGLQLRWALARSVSGPAILTKNIGTDLVVIDADKGEIEVVIRPEDSVKLVGPFYTEIKAFSDGDPITVHTGKLTFSKTLIKKG